MSDMDGDTGALPDDEDPQPFGARAPWARKDPRADDRVKHSPLVGYMSVPVHRRFPIRRSTLVMAIAFLGLGAVLYFNPAQSDTKGAVVGGYYIPGAVPVSTTTTSPTSTSTTTTSTTTTTHPSTTTTTQAVGSTTTTAPRTSTTGVTTTTTTTILPGASGGGTTTTQSPGTGTTTSRSSTTTTKPGTTTGSSG